MENKLEARSRLIASVVLLLLGGWVLHGFLALLIWAVVIAIITWPLYQRLLTLKQFQHNVTWTALGLILLIGAIFLAPLGYGLSRLLQEMQSLGGFLSEAQQSGIPPPAWLETVPFAGQWAKNGWMDILGSPKAANNTLHWLGTGTAMGYSKAFASQILHRFFGFLITLLVLFFVYQHGEGLGRKVLKTSRNLFGEVGIHYVLHAIAAVRATVNGLVLVGLGEGLLLGVGYAFAGLSHPALLGAITGILAMIPFAAKLIFGGCAAVLFFDGHLAAGTGLLIFGLVVLLVADNYVRPALIGGAVKLPFIWTLLGIFGGLENFGLLGLFLGPTLMAILMSIWRDWTLDMPRQ
ncbi:MAG: AI-2E family transporter [Methylosarcina sp.]